MRSGYRARLAAIATVGLAVFCAHASAAPEIDNDSRLWRLVEQRLVDQGDAPIDTLKIEIEDRIAVLSGMVEKPLSRRWFGQLAGSVPGIRGVVNLITVDPAPRADRDIRSAVGAALADDPATAGQPIEVFVVDGDVTLGGTVASRTERDLAALAALDVAGVNAVNNDIAVSLKKRPDSGIATDIRQNYRWDPWLCDAPPDVEVENGRVTLSGAVPDTVAVGRAARLAHVDGVIAVDNHMTVASPSSPDAGVSAPNPADQLKADAESVLAHDPRLRSFAPEIAVSGQVMEISGEAPSLLAKSAIIADAESVAGGSEVLDSMTVSATARPTDASLAQDIHDALARDPLVPVDDITLAVTDGRVLMRGPVNDAAARAYAEAIARRVPGVTGITDETTVMSPGARRLLSDQASSVTRR
jgi:osmotically-inducible protein OsmY